MCPWNQTLWLQIKCNCNPFTLCPSFFLRQGEDVPSSFCLSFVCVWWLCWSCHDSRGCKPALLTLRYLLTLWTSPQICSMDHLLSRKSIYRERTSPYCLHHEMLATSYLPSLLICHVGLCQKQGQLTSYRDVNLADTTWLICFNLTHFCYEHPR